MNNIHGQNSVPSNVWWDHNFNDQQLNLQLSSMHGIVPLHPFYSYGYNYAQLYRPWENNMLPASRSPEDSNDGRRSGKRTLFKKEQLERLKARFKIRPNIKKAECEKLGNEIGLTREQVKIWFQNKRYKDRKQAKKSGDLQEMDPESVENVENEKSSPCGTTLASSPSTSSSRNSLENTPPIAGPGQMTGFCNYYNPITNPSTMSTPLRGSTIHNQTEMLSSYNSMYPSVPNQCQLSPSPCWGTYYHPTHSLSGPNAEAKPFTNEY